jgi:Zn-dependent protease with chaperone function
MSTASFRQWVDDYDHRARMAPGRFAAVTALWALLGQGVIVAAMLLAVWGLAYTTHRLLSEPLRLSVVMWALASLSLLWSTSSALWLRESPVKGRRLHRSEAPKLFALIDKVHQRCGRSPPDIVLLDKQLNASILQQPRLGVLGWHRDVLVLGLPLLMALDVKQLAAVMAHECGHLCGGHGKLWGWIYRTRMSWLRLSESRTLAGIGASVGGFALQLFFNYFFPRFNARAFVLSRSQEVEADRVACAVVGAKKSAEGLLSMAVTDRFLDEVFWPQIWQTSRQQPKPEAHPFTDMRSLLREALRHASAGQWLRQALKQIAEPDDTHPSLRDRVRATEAPLALPSPLRESAAEALCAKALDDWVSWADVEWQQEVQESWTQRFREARRDVVLLEELAQEHAQGALTSLADGLLWVRTAWRQEGVAVAHGILKDVIERHPNHEEPRFLMAGLELCLAEQPGIGQEGAAFKASGLARLRALAQRPPSEWALAAAQRLEDVYESAEAFEALAQIREVRKRLEAKAQEALSELYDFSGQVDFTVPSYSKRVLRPILEVLRREPAAGRAFLICRALRQTPGWTLHMLVVERKRGVVQPDEDHWWWALAQQIDMPLRLMVVDPAHAHWIQDYRQALVEHIKGLHGACIYSGRSL